VIVLAYSNLIFWLGIVSPLVLVCLIFVVVGIAGHKQDAARPLPGATEDSKRLEPVEPPRPIEPA
jgi:hypothetical protein